MSRSRINHNISNFKISWKKIIVIFLFVAISALVILCAKEKTIITTQKTIILSK
jgi:hypothetical protein